MTKHNFTVIRDSGRTSWHGDTEYRAILDLVYAPIQTRLADTSGAARRQVRRTDRVGKAIR